MFVNCYMCDSCGWSIVPAGKIRWSNGGILTFVPQLQWVGFLWINNIHYICRTSLPCVYIHFLFIHVFYDMVLLFDWIVIFYFGDLKVIVFPCVKLVA